MQHTDLTQLGVAAVIVLLLLDKIFSFLKNREKPQNGDRVVNEMKDWYQKQTLEKKLADMIVILEDTVRSLERLVQKLER